MLMALFILILPLLRDLVSKEEVHYHKWIVFTNLILINSVNPRIIHPFINYLINEKAKRNHRTAINSIIFIMTTLFSCLFLNIMSYFYSVTFSSQFWLLFQPFNKYIIFIVLANFLLVAGMQMIDYEEYEEDDKYTDN